MIERGHGGSEFWQVESLPPDETIQPGTTVIVRGSRGLTVLVEPEGAGTEPVGGKWKSGP